MNTCVSSLDTADEGHFLTYASVEELSIGLDALGRTHTDNNSNSRRRRRRRCRHHPYRGPVRFSITADVRTNERTHLAVPCPF